MIPFQYKEDVFPQEIFEVNNELTLSFVDKFLNI